LNIGLSEDQEPEKSTPKPKVVKHQTPSSNQRKPKLPTTSIKDRQIGQPKTLFSRPTDIKNQPGKENKIGNVANTTQPKKEIKKTRNSRNNQI